MWDENRDAFRIMAVMIVAIVASALAYSGFAFHIPYFMKEWTLGADQIGWITTALNLAYMIFAPVLLLLTDRIDARQIFLIGSLCNTLAALLLSLGSGFWAAFGAQFLLGIGMSSTFMPGVRILTDRLAGVKQSRAVAIYMAGFSSGSAISYLVVGQLSAIVGAQPSFALVAIGPILSSLCVLLLISPTKQASITAHRGFDLRQLLALFRNRHVLSRSIAWMANNFEFFGLMPWVVAFLTFALTVRPESAFSPDLSIIAALIAGLGIPAAMIGNEAAVRWGYGRVCIAIMLCSATAAVLTGFSVLSLPFLMIAGMIILFGVLAAADQSALTNSLLADSPPEQRGAIMAFYSAIGSIGALAGPLIFGLILNWGGVGNPNSWLLAFAILGLGGLVGPIAVAWGRVKKTAA